MATKTASGVSIDFGINPDAAMILASRIASSIPLGVIPKDRLCTAGKLVSITHLLYALMKLKKRQNHTASKKVRRQGAQSLRSEAYLSYAATTKDEAQRSIRTFYEAVML
jgi:hypothetical protein